MVIEIGKARSYEMIDLRKKIISMIVDSPELVHLLGEDDSDDPSESIPFNKVFPHEYIPEVITETKRFLNFEINAYSNGTNDVYKNLTIIFYVVCHKDVVRYKEKGREYLWYDKVVCALDELFSDNNTLTVKKMGLDSNVAYYPQDKFKGRVVVFTTMDYSNGKKYGK